MTSRLADETVMRAISAGPTERLRSGQYVFGRNEKLIVCLLARDTGKARACDENKSGFSGRTSSRMAAILVQEIEVEHTKWIYAFAALIALGGCGSQAQDQSRTSPDKIKAAAPEREPAKVSGPLKPDADAPTGEASKDKEKRANTPPGKDRAGGGPLEGAIVDPAGVTQK